MIRDDMLYAAGETLAKSQTGRGLLDLVQRVEEHGGHQLAHDDKAAFVELLFGVLGIEHRRAIDAVRAALDDSAAA